MMSAICLYPLTYSSYVSDEAVSVERVGEVAAQKSSPFEVEKKDL